MDHQKGKTSSAKQRILRLVNICRKLRRRSTRNPELIYDDVSSGGKLLSSSSVSCSIFMEFLVFDNGRSCVKLICGYEFISVIVTALGGTLIDKAGRKPLLLADLNADQLMHFFFVGLRSRTGYRMFTNCHLILPKES